ncbi:hypothetical protein EJB05_04591, partial [Eragrostis curvula]
MTFSVAALSSSCEARDMGMEKILEPSSHAEYSQLESHSSGMRKSCLLLQSTNKHKPIKLQIRHCLPSSAVASLGWAVVNLGFHPTHSTPARSVRTVVFLSQSQVSRSWRPRGSTRRPHWQQQRRIAFQSDRSCQQESAGLILACPPHTGGPAYGSVPPHVTAAVLLYSAFISILSLRGCNRRRQQIRCEAEHAPSPICHSASSSGQPSTTHSWSEMDDFLNALKA